MLRIKGRMYFKWWVLLVPPVKNEHRVLFPKLYNWVTDINYHATKWKLKSKGKSYAHRIKRLTSWSSHEVSVRNTLYIEMILTSSWLVGAATSLSLSLFSNYISLFFSLRIAFISKSISVFVLTVSTLFGLPHACSVMKVYINTRITVTFGCRNPEIHSHLTKE
jgi:hypothetical protein